MDAHVHIYENTEKYIQTHKMCILTFNQSSNNEDESWIVKVESPYVERLESGAKRIDYAALERNKAVMDELLAFQSALRNEFNERMAIANDDEDVMILTALWN